VPVRNIRLTLAYDGTDFGLAGAERPAHNPVRIRVPGAGHGGTRHRAVASFAATWTIGGALAGCELTCRPTCACWCREAEPGFSAKESARLRVYAYYLLPAQIGPPHLRRFCWKILRRPNMEALNRLAAVFVGEHDFTTFAAAGDSSRSKVRRVLSSCFYPEGPFLVYRIAATSFVWKMVRSLLGDMEYEARAGRRPVAQALAARERAQAGSSAPARGLFLERVVYDGEELFPL
jgi:tRNA pseudouridine38-40 synthase